MTAMAVSLHSRNNRQCTCAGGARDLTLRQELLDFVLEDSPHSLQPSLCPMTVSATLALVSMRPQLGACSMPSP